MVDFKEKATKWPRINTAEELASCLNSVKVERWREYSHRAAAPCHLSNGAHRAFRFGNGPSGGVIMSCLYCKPDKTSYGDWIERIEEGLGVAIQMRRQDGRMRYWENGGASVIKNRVVKKAPDYGLFATALSADFTVGDMLELPCWFPGIQKKPYSFRWRGRNHSWRQSRPPEDGGMAVARNGGELVQDKRRWEIHPWSDYAKAVASCDWIKQKLREEAVRPMFGMGGDKESPAPHALVFFDVDYKPDADVGGLGRACRDKLRAFFVEKGLAIFESNSGNGYHAVAILDSRCFWDFRRGGEETVHKIGGWEPLGTGSKATTGLAIDLFFPGARFLIALNVWKGRENSELSHRLPHITSGEIDSLIIGGTVGDEYF